MVSKIVKGALLLSGIHVLAHIIGFKFLGLSADKNWILFVTPVIFASYVLLKKRGLV